MLILSSPFVMASLAELCTPHMNHLLAYRPAVIGHNTAFEAMALIYKYLQQNYDYRFTIVKSSTDKYNDPSFKIINISPKDWKVKFLGLLPSSLTRKQPTLDALLNEVDGVLTVDPTIYEQGLLVIEKASLLKKPVWFDTSKTNLQSIHMLDWKIKRRFVLRDAIKKCTGIIATVPKCLERFQDLGLLDENTASKFHFMGHPVDLTKFTPISSFSKTDNILQILVVSRLVPEKGLLYILEALIPILKEHKHVQLQIIGSGMLQQLLEREVTEHGLTQQVIFLGQISYQELPTILGKADIFVNHALSISGWEEYFGVANLEAMACELPCVLTGSGGIHYAIREKDVAVFVDERNVVQLRQAVIHLLNAENERVEMGRRARSYVNDYYGLPVIAEKYHQMLQRGFAQH